MTFNPGDTEDVTMVFKYRTFPIDAEGVVTTPAGPEAAVCLMFHRTPGGTVNVNLHSNVGTNVEGMPLADRVKATGQIFYAIGRSLADNPPMIEMEK